MHWKYVLHCAYASLICNLIAAPTANEIGPHQIVFDNDLTVSRSAGKAIVLLSNITAEEASSRCKSLGESLLSIPTDSEDLQGLSDQLNYLSSSNITSHLRFWTASGSSTCFAHSPQTSDVIEQECDSTFNALCSNSGVLDPTDLKAAVNSSGWEITGYRDIRTFKFLGIPFADSTAGSNRFAPPVAFSGPKKIQATTYGNVCPQP